jgi:predicted adenine nucleotide alpha hydrolase (AANH) superfamily ATPase
MDTKYEIALYFDNDNIHPRTEYLERLNSVKRFAKDNNFSLIITDWSPKKWFRAIGNKEENKDDRRCKLCWRHRLSKTVEYAKKNKFNFFSTTLLTSHYQDKNVIEKIGQEFETKNLKFYIPKKFIDIKTSGFYKQNYCGCVYSLKDRYFEKYSN